MLRLLDIHPSQRRNLSVSYTDQHGTYENLLDLEQKKLVIYNMGKDILEPVEIRLKFSSDNSSSVFQGFFRPVYDSNTCTITAIQDQAKNIYQGITNTFATYAAVRVGSAG